MNRRRFITRALAAIVALPAALLAWRKPQLYFSEGIASRIQTNVLEGPCLTYKDMCDRFMQMEHNTFPNGNTDNVEWRKWIATMEGTPPLRSKGISVKVDHAKARKRLIEEALRLEG